ncbi:hypothetical protein FB566_4039 [Stackebrandtia endophytica]|uniref:Uncharacterized protein n=1 Tax=Stackebrandtia endophytica TaxID=1496996 RepID=A0A543B0T5_9ACTN|nr:hypothetical protein [Stackebrandtia endophytica]TQL78451.1 hypothetical protein FB566_4039 [Stackebrandtia endophytica]
MASIDEFVTSVQSNIEALKQAQTSMDGAKQQAEELSSQFQALGAESMATGAQGLKQGVEQAQSGVMPVITQLEQLITQAQGLKSLRGTGGAVTHTRPPPTPLDAAPAALKEPVAKIGDQVTAPGSEPGALEAELKPSDDDDKRMSKFRRSGRAAVRNAEALQAQSKETTKVVIVDRGFFDPPDRGSEASVGVPQPAPQIIGTADKLDPSNVVGNAVVMTVFAVEAFARRRRRKKS